MKRWTLISVLLLAAAVALVPGPARGEHTLHPGLPPTPASGDPDDLCLEPKDGPAPAMLGEDGIPCSTVGSEGTRSATLSSGPDTQAALQQPVGSWMLKYLRWYLSRAWYF